MDIDNIISQHHQAIAILILLLFILLVRYLEKRRKPEQDANSDNKNPHSKEASPSNKGEKHPTDGEHHSAEQSHWRWQIDVEERRHRVAVVTLSLSVAAIIAAGLSFWESRIQADVAQDQIVAMRDAQRAWVKLSSIQGVSADRRQSVVWFGFIPTYKNIGQTPAQSVNFIPHIFVVGVGPSPTETCNADRRHYASGSGTILFPQDEVRDDETAIQVPIAELSEQEARVHVKQPGTHIYLGVIGCVLYVFTGSNSVHVMGFVGDIYQESANGSLYDAIIEGSGSTESVKIKISNLSFWTD